MVMGCGANVIKILIGLFNFIVFVSGAAVFIVGIVGTVRKDWQQEILSGFLKVIKEVPNAPDLSQNLATSINTVCIVAIVVGSIVMVMGFLGCCGAFCENRCLLYLFASIMVIMIIVELVVGSLAIAYKDQVKEKFATPAVDLIFDNAVNNTESCDTLKVLQSTFKCCGKKGIPVDPTKCKDADCKGITTGCEEPFGDWLKSGLMVAGIVLLVFMALEFSAVIFSCCLICAIREGTHYSTYRSGNY